MKRLSLRERARAAGRELNCQGGFEFGDLSGFLEIKTRQEEKSLRYAVQDLLKAGDFRSRQGGGYHYVERPAGAPDKGMVMWRFLRLNRQAAVTKLMAVSGAARSSAEQFGEALVRIGVAARTGDGFRLLQDPGPELPFDADRADRARNWREQRKEALAKLDAVFAAVAEARMAVSELEEG